MRSRRPGFAQRPVGTGSRGTRSEKRLPPFAMGAEAFFLSDGGMHPQDVQDVRVDPGGARWVDLERLAHGLERLVRTAEPA